VISFYFNTRVAFSDVLRVKYSIQVLCRKSTGEFMAQVFPFRAYRFNPDLAPFDRVLTQPYDKISPERQAEYYAAHPHNLIEVEKGRVFPDDSPQNNVYTRAAAKVEEWIR